MSLILRIVESNVSNVKFYNSYYTFQIKKRFVHLRLMSRCGLICV